MDCTTLGHFISSLFSGLYSHDLREQATMSFVLLNYDVIDGIQQQNKNGVAQNTPYKLHTMASITGVRP